jgi:hypothetical protein
MSLQKIYEICDASKCPGIKSPPGNYQKIFIDLYMKSFISQDSSTISGIKLANFQSGSISKKYDFARRRNYL